MYFKLTNNEECHNGYQYKTGLNGLDKEFENDSCIRGGFYFTDLKNLDKFYDCGVWLRIVVVPEDAQMVKDESGDKWRANKIILGDRYPLFSIETIKKFNLNVNASYIKCASEQSGVDSMKLLKSCRTYFKITNEKECHYGYQYHDGLNILDRPFESNGSCVEGGLYFTDLKNLSRFYKFGIWLREITIPDDALMVEDPSGGKWRADRIILGERYPLYNIGTIKKFNLEIDNDYIDHVCAYGKTDVLSWAYNCNHLLGCTSTGIEYASSRGHVAVLEWWLKIFHKFDLKLKYASTAMDGASIAGHIEVLEWWKSSGLDLKYTSAAIDEASYNNQVDVLEWWKSSGLYLKYTSAAIDKASANGHIKVLEWWKRSSGFKLEYTSNGLDRASDNGRVNILKKDTDGLKLKYTREAIDHASELGHVNILEWWKNSGLELNYTGGAMDYATWENKVSVLEWWKNSGLQLMYTWRALESVNHDVATLKWWTDSGLPLRYFNARYDA